MYYSVKGPLIMRIDNDEFDKTQELATCSWLLMNKVEDAMEEHGKYRTAVSTYAYQQQPLRL